MKRTVSGILLTILFLTIPVFSATNINEPFPHIETIQYKVYDDVEAMTYAMLIDQEIEMMPGPSRNDLLKNVQAAGYNQTIDPEASFGFMAIQCRDVYCSHAADGPAGKTPGETCQPLNNSAFRVALSYIWGMDYKWGHIYEYYQGPFAQALEAAVPPAQAVWYNNVDVMPDTDGDTAWAILINAGYTLGTGGDDGYLLNPDGSRVRDIEVLYSTGHLNWEYILGRFVAQVNDFFYNKGAVNGPNFILTDRDYLTLYYELMRFHDFDMLAFDITGLGTTPDWCYDFYHSTTIGEGEWNFCGFQNETMDNLLETMMFNPDYNTVKNAVWEMQRFFVWDWMPLFPVITGYAVTTWHPKIDNFIGSPGPGADQCYLNWRHVHWGPDTVFNEPPYEGRIGRGLEDEPDTLNPWNDNTESGRLILDGLCEPLMMPTPPDPSIDMPWLSYKSEVEYINIPELEIVDGMKVTYYLRNDVYWQDTGAYNGGDTFIFPFTADDCQFAFEMLKKWQVGKYERFWKTAVYSEAEDPYEFEVYFNATSLFYEDYPQIASFFPKHIYYILDEMAEQTPGTSYDKKLVWDSFIPSEWDYQNWTTMAKTLWYISTRPKYSSYYYDWPGSGMAPRDSNAPQTAQVGIGAFVFDYYDNSTLVGQVHSSDVYWVDGPIKSVIDAPYVAIVDKISYCIDDPIEYNVIISNYGYKVDGELASKTVDVIVYEAGIVRHTVTDVQVNVFDWTTLGPYTISTLCLGAYNITVEILQDSTVIDTYTHIIHATVREDVDVDFCISLLDVMAAASAFGSDPLYAYLRWDARCDIDGDFTIRAPDILSIALMYTWGICEQVPPQGPVRLIVDRHPCQNTINKTVVGIDYNFTAYIEIANVTNLYGFDIRLDYNATLLELVDWGIILPPGWTSIRSVFGPGYIACVAEPPSIPFTGNATIVELTFTGKMNGNVTIDPTSSILANSWYELIPFTPVSSEIMVSYAGDVNMDGKVRVDDVLDVALAFGTDCGGLPNGGGYYYEPNLDITNDLKIRVDDILIASLNFGTG